MSNISNHRCEEGRRTHSIHVKDRYPNDTFLDKLIKCHYKLFTLNLIIIINIIK